MIVRQASEYPSSFFSSVPTILTKPREYYKSITPIFELIRNTLPLLHMVCLPTTQPKTAFIQGLLLPAYAIKEMCLLPEQYTDYGLPIFAHIPEDFQSNGIEVYDSCKRINWEQIPDEIKHCHFPTKIESAYGIRKICTHKPEYITTKNCVLNVLLSAFYLFQEYNRYDAIKKFELKCLPHGEKNIYWRTNNGR